MAAQDVAAAHYQRQQRITRQAAEEAQRLWQLLDRSNLSASWATLTPQALQVLTAAQILAATGASGYVSAAVEADGGTPDPAGRVVPTSLAGVASDGRDLLGLLAWPMIETKTRLALGQPLSEAVGGGLASLLRIVSTQVQDAGRVATGVGIVADRSVAGYVRVLSPPSCSRCAVLAGRFYRWSQGFQRHPHCDCVHQPTTREAWNRHETSAAASPRRYFDSLTRSEQDRIFTRAGAEAIRDGADISRVVNARRGMHMAGDRSLTTEATTGRGTGQRTRPMPEQIYTDAATRDEAIAALRRFGYIT